MQDRKIPSLFVFDDHLMALGHSTYEVREVATVTHSLHPNTIALTRFPMNSMANTVIYLLTVAHRACSTRLDKQTRSATK